MKIKSKKKTKPRNYPFQEIVGGIYDHYISIFHQPGNWWKMLQHMIYITNSFVDGGMLSFLMSYATKTNRWSHWPMNQFFYCKSDTVYRYLKLTQRQQLRILTRLQKANFIIVTKRGLPAKRYIQINLKAICEASNRL